MPILELVMGIFYQFVCLVLCLFVCLSLPSPCSTIELYSLLHVDTWYPYLTTKSLSTQGSDAKAAAAKVYGGGSAPAAPAAPSAPKAPPPPPPCAVSAAPAQPAKAPTADLFAALNKGSAVTSG